MLKTNLRRIMPLLLIFSVVLAACSDLAGDVQIVATVPAQANNPPLSQTAMPLELPPNAPNVANGQRIFQANCTSCHGMSGAGDGELVESGEVPRMGSFLDPVHMRQQSVEFYYDIITNGNLINLMPPWSGSLSLQERWDVAMYVYTLQYSEEQIAQGETLVDNPTTEIQLASDADLAAATGLDGDDAFAAVAYQRIQSIQNWGLSAAEVTEVPEITLESANFSGVITQGSPNASLPDDMFVQLQYGDFLDVTEVLDGTIDENGQFTFTDVPVLANSTYFAVVFYDGRPFLSGTIRTRDLQSENSVDVTIYETSSAPNIVDLISMELVLDHLSVPDLGTGIVTSQFNVYENPTDFVFHLEPEGQDVRVSLLISLPIGSVFLDAPEQGNFIPVEDQFALIDTRPVYPGQHLAETTYFIPYENNAQTIDIRLNNRFNGELRLIVTDPELTIVGENIAYTEDINLGSEEEPIMAKVYVGTMDLQPGESVIFDVEGTVNQNTSSDATILTQEQLLPILLGVVIVVVVLIIALTIYLRSGRSATQREIDRIIMEISRLESMHDAGQINHDAFQQKRSELKTRLAELMAETQTNE